MTQVAIRRLPPTKTELHRNVRLLVACGLPDEHIAPLVGLSVREVQTTVALAHQINSTTSREELADTLLQVLSRAEETLLRARARQNLQRLYDAGVMDYFPAWVGMQWAKHWFITDDELLAVYGPGMRWRLEEVCNMFQEVLGGRPVVQFTFWGAPVKPHMLWLTDPNRTPFFTDEPRE